MTRDLACPFCAAPANVTYVGHPRADHQFEIRCNHAATCPMITTGWPTAVEAVDAWRAAAQPKPQKEPAT